MPKQLMLLARRGKKYGCHSDNVSDDEEAQRVQREYVNIGVETD